MDKRLTSGKFKKRCEFVKNVKMYHKLGVLSNGEIALLCGCCQGAVEKIVKTTL